MEATNRHLGSETLRDWLRFIRGEAHILREQPALLFQQAANQPDTTSPAQIARLRFEAGLEKRGWLRWVNKPRYRDPCLMTFVGHTDAVLDVAVAPAQARIASAGSDKTIRIWNSKDGRELLLLTGHVGAVNGLAMTTLGRLISVGEDMMVLVWDIETGKEIRMIAGNNSPIRSVAALPSRDWIATGTKEGTLNILRIDDGARLFRINAHGDQVSSVAISRDDRWIVSGSWDTTVKIWGVEGLREFGTLRGHKEWVHDVAITPDNRYVVSAGHDEIVILWDLETAKKVRVWKSPSDPVFALAVTEDGGHIIAGTRAGSLKVWDVSGRQGERTLRAHTDPIHSLAVDGDHIYSSSGDALAITNDCTVRIWDRRSSDSWHAGTGHLTDVSALVFTPDGRSIISGGHDNTIKFWEAESGAEIRTLAGHKNQVGAVAVSLDGRTLVSGSAGQWSQTNSIIVWDARSGRIKKRLKLGEAQTSALAISPDGESVVFGDNSSAVKIWNARNGKIVRILNGHQGCITGIAVAGGRIISVSSGQMIHAIPRSRFELGGLRVWDIDTGEEIFAFPAPHLGFRALSVSPDGSQMAIANSDGTIGVWKTYDGEPIGTLGEPVVRNRQPHWESLIPERTSDLFWQEQKLVSALAFTSNGSMIVSANPAGEITVWDLKTGETQARYIAPGSCLAIATHENLIAAGIKGGAIFILRMLGISVGSSNLVCNAASTRVQSGRSRWKFWQRR